MKQLFTFTLAFLVSCTFIQRVNAQDDERRNKIQMVISYGGKTVTTELIAISSSISRYADEELSETSDTGKDTSGITSISTSRSNSFNLGMEIKKMDPELLKVLAKRKSYFDGTITITDSYGKNPTKTLRFKRAGLSSYSDHYTSASYSDAYGNISLSITCVELAIDGINIE